MLKNSSSSLGENLTGPENFYEFPMANKDETSVILHHPSNLWGFDDKQLIIAVVTAHPILQYTHGTETTSSIKEEISTTVV